MYLFSLFFALHPFSCSHEGLGAAGCCLSRTGTLHGAQGRRHPGFFWARGSSFRLDAVRTDDDDDNYARLRVRVRYASKTLYPRITGNSVRLRARQFCIRNRQLAVSSESKQNRYLMRFVCGELLSSVDKEERKKTKQLETFGERIRRNKCVLQLCI